jgi:hypothetical protein
MTSNRAVTTIAAGILGLVVIGAVVVLLAEDRKPATFPAGSPEAAMQAYLAAWEDGDSEKAYGFFSEAVRSQVTLADYQNAVSGFGDVSPGDEAVYIDAAQISGDRATVHLTVEHYFGDGPGAETYRSTTTVRMVRQADAWKLDQQLIGVEAIPIKPNGF